MKVFFTTNAAKKYITNEAGFLTNEILTIRKYPCSCFWVCYVVTKHEIPDFI